MLTFKRKSISVFRASLLAIFVLLISLASAQTVPTVIELPSGPKPAQMSAAKLAFAQGAVIAMRDTDPVKFSALFNVAMPISGPQGRRCIVAALQRADSQAISYEGALVQAGPNNLNQCEADFQAWVQKQQLLGDSGGMFDNPYAWTLLQSSATMDSKDSAGNLLQEIVNIYRANSNDTNNDYYLVLKQVDTQPNWETTGGITNPCIPLVRCGWYTWSRTTSISTINPVLQIYDHGPFTNTGTSTSGFNIGASLSASPGISAGYTHTWTQPNVTTDDNTKLNDPSQTASWYDHMPGADIGKAPGAQSTGLFANYQSVIFRASPPVSSFTVKLNDKVDFRYDHPTSVDDLYPTNTSTFTVQVPVLQAPPTIYITPNGTAELPITAVIPGSTAGLTWSLTLQNPNQTPWLGINSTTGSNSKRVTVTAVNAPVGGSGVLSLNTAPAYAAPSVRTGGIPIHVQVVTEGVLLSGGTDWNGNILGTAEVWNPATGASTPAGNLVTARHLHTSTTLQDGRVLIAGGTNGAAQSTSELYDSSHRFTAGPNMVSAHVYHTATLLNDGTVLIAGGLDGNNNATNVAEIYDPVSNTFKQVGNLNKARQNHTATLLQTGQVLITGGSGNAGDFTGFGEVELYDPGTQTFSHVGGLNTGRQGHMASLLANGQVLIMGGWNGFTNPVASAELYTPSTQQCTYTGNIPAGVREGGAATLTDGRVLLAGGYNSNSAGFLYSAGPGTFAWTPGFMTEVRDFPNVLLLDNGQAFVAGGVIGQTGNSQGTAIEAFDPTLNAWSVVGHMTTARNGAGSSLTPF